MKKVISLFLVFLISLSFSFSQSSAASSETKYKNKIFKQTILTRNELRNLSNWNKIVDAIEMYFIKNRLKSESTRIKELEDLDKKLRTILDYFAKKSFLSTKEKEQKLLVENIFFRTTLELNYN